MTPLPTASCNHCVHYQANTSDKCDAFPQGIPEAILIGKEAHKHNIPGDHGVHFEPGEPKTEKKVFRN